MDVTKDNLSLFKLPMPSELEKGNRLRSASGKKNHCYFSCLKVILLLQNSTFSNLPVWVQFEKSGNHYWQEKNQWQAYFKIFILFLA